MTIFKELAPDQDIEVVTGVQFCLLSPEEIRARSVVEVVTHEIYSGSEPVQGGVLDSRMGVIDASRRCPTCGQKNTFCPGHFGHVELAKPMFYVQFLDIVKKVVKCVCFRCSALVLPIEAAQRRALMKLPREKRFETVYKLCSKSVTKRDCPCCGARQPNTVGREMILKLVLEWKRDVSAAAALARDDNNDDGGATLLQPHSAAAGPGQLVLMPEDVHKVLRRISDDDAELLGFHPQLNRPEWMICTVFPVPPPCVRPTVHNDIGQRREDDLTHKICEVVKNNTTLRTKIANNASPKEVEALGMLLQFHLATYADNQLPGMAPSQHRNGRPIKSVTERLKSKEGRIRGNLMGKRVDFSARSVITPDPNISIDELGVPLRIAMNLTFPEIVNGYNVKRLQDMVDNGPDVYPGAKFVRRVDDGRTIGLHGSIPRGAVVLAHGDIVDRHLVNGDYVLFNRQPSLHKMSMMAHRVRVMPFDTFRLNVCVTPCYNADYDGDEMNMHVPQSLQTAVELRELAAVPLQILSPRESSPIINIVQDIALGIFRITQPDVLVARKRVFNLLSCVENFTGRMHDGAADMVTGSEVLSHVIPRGTYLQRGGVEVSNGRILSGVMTKGVFSGGGNSLMQNVFKELGPNAARALLDDTQQLICNWMCSSGFSVGMSDLIVGEDIRSMISDTVDEKKSEIRRIFASLHDGTFANDTIYSNQEHFESLVKSLLNEVGNAVYKALPKDIRTNRMMNMIKDIGAGSKGADLNVIQLTCLLGQQEVEEGAIAEKRRVPYGFEGRTLPHFTKYDDSPEARGFVEHSFVEGLTPHEFFFHAMAGREGLVDTAVKSVTGDTPIIICEAGHAPRRVQIGEWVDGLMDGAVTGAVKTVAQEEGPPLHILEVPYDVHVPTCDEAGVVTWGKLTAVTRHGPGERLFRFRTRGGRQVVAADSETMLVWDDGAESFLPRHSSKVRVGDHVPVVARLPPPPNNDGPGLCPDRLALNHDAGAMVGLVMSGCARVEPATGCISIECGDPAIQAFVAAWLGARGVTMEGRVLAGHSVPLATCLSTRAQCSIEALAAPEPYVAGLLWGFWAGAGGEDGNAVCASVEQAEVVAALSARLGVLCEVAREVPAVTVRGREFLQALADKVGIGLPSGRHEDIDEIPRLCNDAAVDVIVEVEVLGVEGHTWLYDVTVPSTLNFATADGLCLRDTSEIGYLQRKLVKAMEDCKIDFDMTVRNVSGGIVQFSYGGDGHDAALLERQAYPVVGMTLAEVERDFHITPDTVEGLLRNVLQADVVDDLRSGRHQELFDAHFARVLEDRRMVIRAAAGAEGGRRGGAREYTAFVPVNFDRAVHTALRRFCPPGVPSDLNPADVITRVEELLARLRPGRTQPANGMLGAIARAHLNPVHLLANKSRRALNSAGFAFVLERVEAAYNASIAHPSELVGIVAAQSIGEPATQMTLNTFHLSGVSAASKAVQGMPRLTELLRASKKIKTPLMSVYMDRAVSGDGALVQRLLNEVECTYIRDLITESAVFFDPDDMTTTVDDDRVFVAAWREYAGEGCAGDPAASGAPWALRLVFDRERMLERGVTMFDVHFALRTSMNEEVSCLYSDDNAAKLVMRLRLPESRGRDMLYDIRLAEHQIVNDVLVKGVPGIRKVVKRREKFTNARYENDDAAFFDWEEFVLYTDGSNLREVLALPLVDKVHTISNDPQEILVTLGIEAARRAILNEVKTTLANLFVQERHLEMLADVMTLRGVLMSVDRHGINKGDIGPLAKCSFEESAEKLIIAGAFAEHDRMTGVSANIILGQIPSAGTGDTKVLLDLARLVGVAAAAGAAEERAEAGTCAGEAEDFEFSTGGDYISAF